MLYERLQKQMDFILEMDKLKTIIRRTYVNGGKRLENSAEHSWHVAMQALLLTEYANQPVDELKVIKMLLIHDIVEILAGDTYIFSTADMTQQQDREHAAAAELFAMLPEDQAEDLTNLWLEFEENTSPDARFAKAIDRLIPLLHNYQTRGISWKENSVTQEMVEQNILKIRPGSEKLWWYAQTVVDKAVEEGMLESSEDL